MVLNSDIKIKNNKILLSIIIPVFNVGVKIKPLLNSLCSLVKNHKNQIEIIFINDSSPTWKIEKKLIEDSSFEYKIINQNKSGASISRLNGLTKSSGEYVWFVDSDDYFDVDKIDNLILLINEKKWDVIVFDFLKINMNNNEIIERSNLFHNQSYIFDKDDSKNNRIYTLREWGFRSAALWNKLIKRELFLKNKIDFNLDIVHEDTYVWFQVLSTSSKILYIKDDIYYYCKYDDSNSSMDYVEKNWKSNIDFMLIILDKLFIFLESSKNANFREMNKIINHYIYSDLHTTKQHHHQYYRNYRKKINEVYKKHKIFNRISLKIKILYLSYDIYEKIKKLMK